MGSQEPDDQHAAARSLLLAELATFEAAMWHNEEIGEKRFNFFITLITAVAGGLAALWSAEKFKDAVPEWVEAATWQAGLIVLVFGLLTFLRMRHRDRVTHRFKETMRDIREKYLKTCPGSRTTLGDYEIPIPLYPDTTSELLKRIRKLRQGGYTVSVAAMNGIILAATLVASGIAHNCNQFVAVTCGVLLALVLCLIGTLPIKDAKPSANR